MKKGEIACYKQFLLFSKCFLQLYIFSASKYGIVCNGLNAHTSLDGPEGMAVSLKGCFSGMSLCKKC